jgi:5-formyltetrahydrofolate cyclo-ligase
MMQADKTAARRRYLALRKELAGKERAAAEALIQERLKALLSEVCGNGRWTEHVRIERAPVVGFYAAYRGEVTVHPAALAWRKAGGVTAYPRTNPVHRQMQFFEVDEESQLIPGNYGILEPPPGCPLVPPSALAALVIPGVAFTASGQRLGYGGGYYDGYLAQPGLAAVRIGVAFSCQLADADEWPTDSFDQPVDFVVTEAGVCRCG